LKSQPVLRRRGVRIVEVPISYQPRGKGEGKKIRALQDGSRALWTLLKYRCHPVSIWFVR
jgi:hypothetical protein